MILVDRELEVNIFRQIIGGQRQERILLITADGGVGKSTLMRYFRRECREQDISCALVEFGPGRKPDPIELMRDLSTQLGEKKFPNFCRVDREFHHPTTTVIIGGGKVEGDVGTEIQGQIEETEMKYIAGRDVIRTGDIQVGAPASLTPQIFEWRLHVCSQAFCSELSAWCEIHPVVILLDACEHLPVYTAEWTLRRLLEPLQDIALMKACQKLTYILAGRPGHPLTLTPVDRWVDSAIYLTRLSNFKQEDIDDYFRRRFGLDLKSTYLEAYQSVVRDNAKMMAEIASILAQSGVKYGRTT